MGKVRRATKATRGKLERALVALESFVDADDFDKVVSGREKQELADALNTIRDIESRLYNGRSL